MIKGVEGAGGVVVAHANECDLYSERGRAGGRQDLVQHEAR